MSSEIRELKRRRPVDDIRTQFLTKSEVKLQPKTTKEKIEEAIDALQQPEVSPLKSSIELETKEPNNIGSLTEEEKRLESYFKISANNLTFSTLNTESQIAPDPFKTDPTKSVTIHMLNACEINDSGTKKGLENDQEKPSKKPKLEPRYELGKLNGETRLPLAHNVQILKEREDTFGEKIDDAVEFFSSVKRAVDIEKIVELKERAESGEEKGPNYDPDSHQKAAWDYGNYVGNEKVAGVARTLSEFLYQFPMYTAKDAASRIKYDKPGKYQPWSINGPGGIKDSFQDIENTKQGATGKPLKTKNGYYSGE